MKIATLSKEPAHSTVYHHLSHQSNCILRKQHSFIQPGIYIAAPWIGNLLVHSKIFFIESVLCVLCGPWYAITFRNSKNSKLSSYFGRIFRWLLIIFLLECTTVHLCAKSCIGSIQTFRCDKQPCWTFPHFPSLSIMIWEPDFSDAFRHLFPGSSVSTHTLSKRMWCHFKLAASQQWCSLFQMNGVMVPALSWIPFMENYIELP